jgi:hypothetical protein
MRGLGNAFDCNVDRCGLARWASSPGPSGGPPDPTVTTVIGTISNSTSTVSSTSTTIAPPIAALGEFPEPPEGVLPEAVPSSLQSVLDEAVANRTIGGGVTSGVILAASGSWSGPREWTSTVNL